MAPRIPGMIVPNDPRRWGNEDDADSIARSAEESKPLTDAEAAELEEIDHEAEGEA